MEEEKIVKPKLTRKEKRELRKEKKKATILSYTPEHDIKYRGPLGVSGLRIVGWIFVMLSAVMLSLTIVLLTNPDMQNNMGLSLALVACNYAGPLAIPCFMLARFGLIFQKKKNIKHMLISFGGLASIVVLLYLLAYYHYGIHLIEKVQDVSYWEARDILENFLHGFSSNKLCFNVFLDMLLWGLYFAIIEYEIKKKSVFKIVLQKILALLPLTYVIVWFIIKILFVQGKVNIDGALLPFIPSSTPLTFVAFIMVSIFLNRRKKLYLQIGGTEEGYQEYLKTNANSLHFSKLTALCFIVAGFIDLIFMFVIKYSLPAVSDKILSITGISNCVTYIFFAPFFVLFSYTREYKGNRFDLFIPIIASIIVILIAFEGIYYSLIEWIRYIVIIFGS